MKVAWRMALGLVALFAVIVAVQADDKDKEKTLKGTITCAKCDLKLEKKCATVIQEKVKKDGKDVEVLYWFDAPSNKKYHSDICQEAKPGSVTGVVTEKDGKKLISVKEVKYDK